jgi:hypothetical protein
MRRSRRLLPLVGLSALLLVACDATPGTTPAPTPAVPQAGQSTSAGLAEVKTYLVDKATRLDSEVDPLRTAADAYYNLAQATDFDYAKLWDTQREQTTKAVMDARAAWESASPEYERMEGIVAGVPSLARYDVILDAGASGAEGGESVVPFDLTLPDGRVLAKPGNLFGVVESTLWGTFADFAVPGVAADYDGDGKAGFGETLPDANVLKSAAEAMDKYTGDLLKDARAWEPTAAEAFGALVANVPTVGDFFGSWKASRFVLGDASQQRDFAVISRLSDIVDNVSSWQAIYGGLSPMAQSVDAATDAQITEGLTNLKAFVAGLFAQEQDGKRFTPEEADGLSAQAEDRATAIVGQISQVAAQLKIDIQE